MVLCPYVYLMLHYHLPPLILQPSEIHSIHWVPLRALLSPSLSTWERCDLSERFTRRKGRLVNGFFRTVFGQALFPAIHLVPSESLYCSSAPDFLPNAPPKRARKQLLLGNVQHSHGPQPLNLWGLTLGDSIPLRDSNVVLMSAGMAVDLLRPLPSYIDSDSWIWPTLSPLDYQFAIWLLSYSFRKRKLHEANETDTLLQTRQGASRDAGIDGMDDTTFSHQTSSTGSGSQDDTLLRSLHEYFGLTSRAVLATLIIRFGIGTFLVSLLINMYRRRELPVLQKLYVLLRKKLV